jgi:hypothetical protein
METGVTVVETSSARPMLDLPYHEKITAASGMANLLNTIIRKQKFFQVIQGKEFVKVEGWITLGSLLGITPREKSVTELADGSYIAEIELVRVDTGRIIGGASALCSVDEKRWGNADKYARRSMSVTRATGKAYRISFGWIIGLAGFETCNAEEMPEQVTVTPSEDVYQGTPDQKSKLTAYLKSAGFSDEKTQRVLAKMTGKTKDRLQEVMAECST